MAILKPFRWSSKATSNGQHCPSEGKPQKEPAATAYAASNAGRWSRQYHLTYTTAACHCQTFACSHGQASMGIHRERAADVDLVGFRTGAGRVECGLVVVAPWHNSIRWCGL